jgi:hypothetical protein
VTEPRVYFVTLTDGDGLVTEQFEYIEETSTCLRCKRPVEAFAASMWADQGRTEVRYPWHRVHDIVVRFPMRAANQEAAA